MATDHFQASTLAGARFKRAFSHHWHVGAIVAVLLLFGFIRYRLRDFPLERDEGEYAYAGQLILQGVPPYKLAYSMKLPGTYVAYSAILGVFGQTPAAIHLGLLLVNAATVLLVYFLGARLSGRIGGVVACACYALLSAGQTVLGMAAHATHFVVLPALAGLLVLLAAVESKRTLLYGLSGLFLGLSFLMKQPGISFLAFAFLYLVFCECRRRPVAWRQALRRVGAFSLASAIPFVITCLILYATGVFGRFWFWTVTYAGKYASLMDATHGLEELNVIFPKIAGPCFGIWMLSACGLTAFLWNRVARQQAVFSLGFTLFSILAVCPGLWFRPHYFILLLPAAALLAGMAVGSACDSLQGRGALLRVMPVLAFILAFGLPISRQSRFFFHIDPLTACRETYGAVPFAESQEVAKYLRDHTPGDARIAVLGSEPQIYFYSGRHAATGYIYTYPLMEPQPYAGEMQKEMIHEIELARPDYLVVVNIPSSWTRWLNSERHIDSWMARYTANGYVLDGVVELNESGPTGYHWGDDARSYRPLSGLTLDIMKRK